MRRLTVFLILATAALQAQVDLFFLQPQQADPSATPGEPHIVGTQPGSLKAPLILFLPGTGAIPSQYQWLTRTITAWGQPIIALNYPNPSPINTLCALAENLDCYERARQEVFTGQDSSPLVAVTRADSIEVRLLRGLQFLHRLAPARGWDQFFTAERVLWHRIIVSGHSQGGGHAGFIAKKVLVARAVMFAAMDYNARQRRVAPWMEQPGATSPSSFFAFGHERDELVDYTVLSQLAWPALGLDRFGPPLPIAIDDFATTRTARMNAAAALGTAHSYVAGDSVIFLDAASRQAVERTWRHLYLGAALATVNAASYAGPAVSSESIIAAFAAGIRTSGAYELKAGGRPARIFATAASQINAILPPLPQAPQGVELIEAGGPGVWSGVLDIRSAAPGVFTRDFSGAGEVAAIWTSNGLTIFGTGWRGASTVRVTLAGQPLQVQFAGAQPEFAGLDQINVLVPPAFASRPDLELRVEADGMPANPTRVSVPAL